MSAGAPVVQVTFATDASTLYAEYNRFLQYVRANPAMVGMGGGAQYARGVGGGQTIINNYYGGAGPGGGGGGGEYGAYAPGERGGGGGGLLGGGRSRGFGRYFGPAIVAHSALRALQGEAEYNLAYGGAGSDMERYKAEQALQQRSFSIPIVGQAAELATIGSRAGTEHTIRQAEATERQTELMERAADQQRRLMEQQSAFRAGPAGSYGYRREEIESRQYEEEQRFKREGAERAKEIERDRQQELSYAKSQASLERAGSVAAGGILGIGGYIPGLNKAAGIRTPQQIEAAQTALEQKSAFDASTQKRGSEQITQDAIRRSQELKDQALKELDYQRNMDTRRAQESAYEERLRYEMKPHVAEVAGIGFEGKQAAEAARHRGNADAAEAIDLETKWKLMGLQREWAQGGEGWALENAGAVDLSGSSTSMKGPFGRDDSGEALQEIKRLLEENNRLHQEVKDAL